MYIDCILQKWLSFHKNNDFITQILPENVKILTLILPDFYLCFTVGGNLVHPPPPHPTHTHTPAEGPWQKIFWYLPTRGIIPQYR
jgi:hypothetical protein